MFDNQHFSLFLMINLYTLFLTVFFIVSFPGHFYLLRLLIPYFSLPGKHNRRDQRGGCVFFSLPWLFPSPRTKTNISPSAYGHRLSPNQNSKLVCALQLFKSTYSGRQYIYFSLLPGIIFTFCFYIYRFFCCGNPDRPMIGRRHSHFAAHLHKVEHLPLHLVTQVARVVSITVVRPPINPSVHWKWMAAGRCGHRIHFWRECSGGGASLMYTNCVYSFFLHPI